MEHAQDVSHLNDEHHERKWTFLHSYCVPYVYTTDIQDHQVKCTECIKEVDWKGFLIDEWDNGIMRCCSCRATS